MDGAKTAFIPFYFLWFWIHLNLKSIPNIPNLTYLTLRFMWQANNSSCFRHLFILYLFKTVIVQLYQHFCEKPFSLLHLAV